MEIDGTNAPSPLLVNQDTTQGVFLRDALLPPTTLVQQTGFVPAWSPERHRRRRPVWIGPIGYRRAVHETLIPATVAGYTVYLDENGNLE
jgi:hypothetical protein